MSQKSESAEARLRCIMKGVGLALAHKQSLASLWALDCGRKLQDLITGEIYFKIEGDPTLVELTGEDLVARSQYLASKHISRKVVAQCAQRAQSTPSAAAIAEQQAKRKAQDAGIRRRQRRSGHTAILEGGFVSSRRADRSGVLGVIAGG